MTFRFNMNQKDQEKAVVKFFREMMNEERIQIGYIGAYMTIPNLHAHFAIVGESKHGSALETIDKKRWCERWAEISGLKGRALEIKDISDSETWEGYIKKNIRSDSRSKYVWYNTKLLQKMGGNNNEKNQ
jgi:hypothetical protein